jgi:hypothetical protein
MPHWVVLVVFAVVSWLVLSVAGGWLIGRLLGLASRRRSSP